MKRAIVLVATIMLFAAAAFGAGGNMGGASQDGSESYPYLIEDLADFDVFAGDSAYWASGVYTMLACDPNLAGRTYTQAPIAGDPNPDSTFDGTAFSGTFDGDDHVIRNLTVDGVNYCGFFGKLDIGSEVKNLAMEDVSITGTRSLGRYYAGGLVGRNSGSIINSYSTGVVTGYGRVGGLVGGNDGEIIRCYSAGTVITLGVNVGNGGWIGGLVGDNDGIITSSYSTGTVIGGWFVGGLVGGNDGSVTNCYSAGNVNGEGRNYAIGGLAGANGGIIANCYSASMVTNSKNYLAGAFLVGAFLGVGSQGIITNSYFYIDSGPDNGAGLALDDVQFQDKNSFVGFDFGGDTSDGTDDYWDIEPGYIPRLAWQDGPGLKSPLDEITTTLSGTGYVSDPFIIASYDDMMEFRINPTLRIGHYILTTDINLVGVTYAEAFIPERFNGHFAGNGHTISNLTIAGNDHLGFFEALNGSVEQLALENVSIISSGFHIGGLASSSFYGSISRCFLRGTISGGYSVGGLVGTSSHTTITNCYSVGAVSGTGRIGGLVGDGYPSLASNEISDCYSTVQVTGSGYRVGGLMGSLGNDNQVENSYFYVYGSPDNDFGLALDDDQLQSKACFAGFDFVGDTSDGTDDNWTIEPGYMPRLAWQNSPGFEAPYLLNAITTSLSGTGYPDDPFVIVDYNDLMEFRTNSALRIGHYSLANDIDLADVIYADAFISENFNGSFAGNGHVISNLRITNYDVSLGFFKALSGSVKDLALENVSINGRYGVGALAGKNFHGNITRCYSTGRVDGYGDVGGLVGYNYALCTITNCYSTAEVDGNQYSGGLVGGNEGSIANCYSAGVAANSWEAGLVGINRGGVIIGSFWDVQTSGVSTSDGGTGKTTAEMKTVNTFTDAGWDFVGESSNGDEDIWRLCVDGSGYPRLAWEFHMHGDFVCGDGLDGDDFDYISDRYLSDGCAAIFDSAGGTVDLGVLAKIGQHWLATPCVDCEETDISGDGKVNIDDIYLLAEQWLCTALPNWNRADFDGDGVVGDSDLDLWIDYWITEGF